MRQNLLRLSFFSLMLLLLPIAAMGAELATPTKTPPDQAAKPAPGDAGAIVPQRKLQFDVSDQEVPITFDLGDPQLAQQRYAASFAIQVRFPERPSQGMLSPRSLGLPESDYRSLQYLLSGILGAYLSQGWNETIDVRKETFQRLAARVPADRLPPEDVLADLTKQANIHVRVSTYLDSSRRVFEIHVVLMAPTADRARQLAQAAIQLIDHGFFSPIRRDFLPMLAAIEKRVVEDREAFKEAEAKRVSSEKQLEELKGYQDINKEMLGTLHSQQRMISVDLAGIQARIQACNKLQGGNLPQPRLDQVESVKISAEIELVGLSAKRDALEELIKKGERRVEVGRQAINARSRAEDLQRAVSGDEVACEWAQSSLDPKVFFGKVIFLKGVPPTIEEVAHTIGVRRIKWVQPDAPSRSSEPPRPVERPAASSVPAASREAKEQSIEEFNRRRGTKTPATTPSRSGR